MSARLWRTRRFPWILLAIFLVLGFLFFQRNRLPRSARARVPAAPVRTDQQQFQKFDLTGYDDKGQKFWTLEGETAKINPGQNIFLDENVTLKFKDTVVRTRRVRWSQDRGLLETDAEVSVHHPNAEVTGRGAVGRPSENFIQINRDIDMQVQDGGRITCNGPMKLYYKENKMVFFLNVKAVDARGVLTAKRMDVYFDAGQKVSRIEATGDVRIERSGDTTVSQRAVYMPSTGSVRLEGNPEITLHEGANLLNAAASN